MNVQGADGKIIPLSAATLQKLIDSGAIKPGTQVPVPLFRLLYFGIFLSIIIIIFFLSITGGDP